MVLVSEFIRALKMIAKKHTERNHLNLGSLKALYLKITLFPQKSSLEKVMLTEVGREP